MNKPGPLIPKLGNIIKSKNPGECSSAILDFAGSITVEHFSEFKADPENSELGTVLKNSRIFPFLSSAIGKGRSMGMANPAELVENIDRLPGLIRSELVDFFKDRYSPMVIDDVANQLKELVSEISSMMHYTVPGLLGSALEEYPGAKTPASLVKRALGPGGDADSLDNIMHIQLREDKYFKELQGLYRKKLVLEQRSREAVLEAVRMASTENSLVAFYKKTGAALPAWHDDLLGEKLFSTPVPYSSHELAQLMHRLSGKGYTEGFLSLEEEISEIKDSFVANGLQLVVDGTDNELVRRMLSIEKATIIDGTRLLHEILLYSFREIQQGINPRMLEALKKNFNRPGTYLQSVEELTAIFGSAAEKARQQGLLALEDDIQAYHQRGTRDDGSITKDDEDAVNIGNELMERGLMLIVDGTDPELVRKNMEFYSAHEQQLVKVLTSLITEGALSIQSGDNPRIVMDKLISYRTDINFTGVIDTLAGLAEKVRGEGISSLVDMDTSGLGPFADFLMAMAADSIDVDTAETTGRMASSRILEEMDLYYDMCMSGIWFISMRMDPEVTGPALELAAPRWNSYLASDEIESLESAMHALRHSSGQKSGAAPGSDDGFFRSLAERPGQWQGFFQCLEKISAHWRSLSLMARGWGMDGVVEYLSEISAAASKLLESEAPGNRANMRREAKKVLVPALASANDLADTLDLDALECKKTIPGLKASLQEGQIIISKDNDDIISRKKIELDSYDNSDFLGLFTRNELRELKDDCENILSKHSRSLLEKVNEVIKNRGLQPLAGLSSESAAVSDILNANRNLFSYNTRLTLLKDFGDRTDEKNDIFIMSQLLLFEDLARMTDIPVQKVLREVDSQDLAKALHCDEKNISKKILSNMSERAGQLLKEDIDFMGPINPEDMHESRRKIMNIVSKLALSGEIDLPEDEDASEEKSPNHGSISYDTKLQLIREVSSAACDGIIENLRGEQEAAHSMLDLIETEKDVAITRFINSSYYRFGPASQFRKDLRDPDAIENGALRKAYHELAKTVQAEQSDVLSALTGALPDIVLKGRDFGTFSVYEIVESLGDSLDAASRVAAIDSLAERYGEEYEHPLLGLLTLADIECLDQEAILHIINNTNQKAIENLFSMLKDSNESRILAVMKENCKDWLVPENFADTALTKIEAMSAKRSLAAAAVQQYLYGEINLTPLSGSGEKQDSVTRLIEARATAKERHAAAINEKASRMLELIRSLENVRFNLQWEKPDIYSFIASMENHAGEPDDNKISGLFMAVNRHLSYPVHRAMVRDIYYKIKLHAALISMEELEALDDVALQKIIRRVDTGVLITALKNSSPEIVKRFTSFFSERKKRMIIEEAAQNTADDAAVKNAREKIIDSAIELLEYGEIAVQ